MAFYLLIKEHLDTGLKYLCKHVAFSFSECENYKGSKNNFAKKIETPFGVFGSIREASQQIEGYTYSMIWKRLQNDNDWRYI